MNKTLSLKYIFFILILLFFSFPILEAKNSKDVSNTQVEKKSISHKKKYSLQLVNRKDGHPVRSGKNPAFKTVPVLNKPTELASL